MDNKSLGQYCFHPIRQLIKMYCEKIPVEHLPIEGSLFKNLFLEVSLVIDGFDGWNAETKRQNKKLLLVFISKFSRDSAYKEPILKSLKVIVEKKIC